MCIYLKEHLATDASVRPKKNPSGITLFYRTNKKINKSRVNKPKEIIEPFTKQSFKKELETF